jgi:Anti-sigma-K factor rskA, C-terminal/Sigma-70, region 4
MASLESLSPDQRAVLALVLQRGRSYDEIAQLLSIDRAAVRDRALAALDGLGPQTDVGPERRALISDYLLGQLPSSATGGVRDRLAESLSEQAWATALATELAPLASRALPEIPVQTSVERPRSRLGGAILLAGGAAIAAAVVIVVIVASSGGSTSRRQPIPATARSSSTTPASTSAPAPQPVAQINLNSPQPHSAAKGVAEVLTQGTTNEIAIVATGLAPNTTHPPNAYAVWLYNSPADSRILGFVNPGVSRSGRLQAATELPAGAGRFRQLIVTLETQATPRAPGQIVLQGALTGLS